MIFPVSHVVIRFLSFGSWFRIVGLCTYPLLKAVERLWCTIRKLRVKSGHLDSWAGPLSFFLFQPEIPFQTNFTGIPVFQTGQACSQDHKTMGL